ncbi:MAG: DUF899 family protein [Verrucomicrobia bacterium]|nr:DUF899 family protein [Verrucomicrobiota bacterium]
MSRPPRAPIEEIELVRKRMGWKFTWVSSYRSDFNYDFNVSLRVNKTNQQPTAADVASARQSATPSTASNRWPKFVLVSMRLFLSGVGVTLLSKRRANLG